MSESVMGQSLNNWLQKYDTSVMRQNMAICNYFPEHTKDAMIGISESSANILREKGAPITQDYTLGKVLTGTRNRVLIPRPPGTIGSFHTHPMGWTRPSPYDLLDALERNDKVMCIGASGKIGTKIACYTPKDPRWSELRGEFASLAGSINEFNKGIGRRYKPKGLKLRKLLDRVGKTDYVAAVQAMSIQEIEEDVEQTEEIVRAAEEGALAADSRIRDADNALKTAEAELEGTLTEEQTKEAEFKLHKAREYANRMVEQAQIEHERAGKARAEADEAAIRSEIKARGMTPVDSDEANRFIREGATLELKRQSLIDELNRQLIYMGYKEQWRPQRKVNGWEAEPLMLDSCKIIWEHLPTEEELGWEL